MTTAPRLRCSTGPNPGSGWQIRRKRISAPIWSTRPRPRAPCGPELREPFGKAVAARNAIDGARTVATLDGEQPMRPVDLVQVPGPDRIRLDQPCNVGRRRELGDAPEAAAALDELDPGERGPGIGDRARADCVDDAENAEAAHGSDSVSSISKVCHRQVENSLKAMARCVARMLHPRGCGATSDGCGGCWRKMCAASGFGAP